MMLKHGVMHREFIELSKEIYVDIARKEYGLRGRPTNVARIALLTGLDRKEVARIRKNLEQGNRVVEPAHRQDRIARVLAGWHLDSDYLDGADTPSVIPLDGAAPSFEDLVKRYGGDVPAITILRELQRVKAVRLRGKSKVQVLRRNYRLDTADPEALSRSGSVLSDIGRTVTHNLYRPAREPSRFEARASNTNIPVSVLPDYRSFIYEESQAFLEKVDEWLSHHEIPADEVEGRRPLRLGIGMYWIQSDPSEVAQ
jgi:hypothetical protein